MAQYKINATDCYQSSGGRAAILSCFTEYNGVISGTSVAASNSATVYIKFSLADTIYNKKKYISRGNIYTYVDSTDGVTAVNDGSSPLPSGMAYYRYVSTPTISDYGNSNNGMYGSGYHVIPSQTESDGVKLYYPAVAFVPEHYRTKSYILMAKYKIQTHTGDNPPYAYFELEDVMPYSSNISPTAGSIVPKFVDNTFSWDFEYDSTGIAGTISQAYAKFRWRPYGQSAYNETITYQKSITIPKNTFFTEYIEYQVVVVSDDGVEGTPSPWTMVTTFVKPYAISLTPASYGKAPKFCDNTFSWEFEYDSAGTTGKLTQKSAKFRWRAQGTTSYTQLTVGVDEFIIVPKNTFTSRYIEWSVVLTSSDNVEGNPSVWTVADTYVIPYATNFYPNSAGGVAAKHGATTFSWQFTFDVTNVSEPYNQKSAKFRYRPYGVTPYTEVNVNTDQYYKLPAETFSAEFMEWQVALTSSDDVTGAFSAWVKVPTSDTISKPLIRYPEGQIINGKLLNRFAWLHKISTNTAQTRYEAQYSLNGGATWNLLSTAITDVQYFDVPADTFFGGSLSWRVRTYNTDNIVGLWSDIATCTVKSTPPTPVITTETISPRPTLAWIGSDQQAFQIQVGEYDSGSIYGINMQYDIPVYLDNGAHTIKVRTQNAYNFWSEWGERSFILDVVKPTAPSISVISNYDIGLRLAVSYKTPKCIVYRREFGMIDFYSIATVTNETEYADYTVASGVRYEYFVRAVNADSSFSDSDIVDGVVTLSATYIEDTERLENAVEFYLRLEPSAGREHSLSNSKTYTNYIGREYPVSEINGTKEHVLPLSYVVKANMYNAVAALADADTVLYRNELGQTIYGSIDNIVLAEKFNGVNKSYLVSFTLRRIDYKEGGEHA